MLYCYKKYITCYITSLDIISYVFLDVVSFSLTWPSTANSIVITEAVIVIAIRSSLIPSSLVSC